MTIEQFAKLSEQDIRQWCVDNPDVVIAKPGDVHSCSCLVAACGKALTGEKVFVAEFALCSGNKLSFHPHKFTSLVRRFDAWLPNRAVTAGEAAVALWETP